MINENQIEKIYQFLDTYVANFPFSGSILLSQRNYPLISAAYGEADRSFNIKNQIDTSYPIASLSKAFTCMGILLLHQDGKLDIHTSANKYLPSFARIDGRILLHHLMSHSSGLPDYRLAKGEKLSEIFTTPIQKENWVKLFLKFEPMFEPGKMFSYSNPAYYLLGMVIEEVSGLSFGEFLQKRIFTPLGMEHSGVDDPTQVIAKKARAYDMDDGNMIQAPFTDARNFYPQGGLYSTVGDLTLWLKCLQNQSLLNENLQKAMFTPYVPAGKMHNNHYAYGWHILEIEGNIVYGHGGFHWGYRSHIEHYPEDDTSCIILSNNGFQDLMKISNPILEFLRGKELKLPIKPNPIISDGKPYLGSYKSGEFEIKLWFENEKFWMKWGQSPSHEVYPTGEGKFHHAHVDEDYTIRKSKDGKLILAGCEQVEQF
ncbi:MAG: beta-lactamase family protein [Bacteroidia bacterium]|nr:beta-lactamase family protein [Bacteroidia bacterium]